MKRITYKLTISILLIAFGLQAQTFNKKIEESFNVNSDVNIVVNTSHSDVVIDTWNRNEVSIEATIEIEGVSEKEAKKLMDKWSFEALGNKSKVKVTSLANSFFFGNDFDFEHTIVIPDIPHFEMPELPELPEMPELIEIPEMPEFEIEIPEIEIQEFHFDYDAYKKDSTYLKKYKERIQNQVKHFKNSDWHKRIDSLKSTDDYKRKVERFKIQSKEYAKKMKESRWYRDVENMRNSEEFRKSIEEARKQAEKLRKHFKDNKELKARKEVKKPKNNKSYNYHFSYSTDDIIDKSKIKITKKIKIKVPKKATFNLNVRHGKLKVPKSNNKMSATVKYGNFFGGIIEGEKNNIIFENTPVIINTLNSGNITLKNVPNASFGTFSNASLFSNSSNVIINEVGENVALSQKFGKIEVLKVVPEFNNLNVVLDYTKGNLNLSNAAYVFQINGKKSTIDLDAILENVNEKNMDGVRIINGYSKDKNASNKLILTTIYSNSKVN
ncbi:hypothetical protein SAMN05444411_11098 [Lutibacter oricola]|uniref:Adhesin domain-containing protein n=1 Tax=Lutibacter oricola TaxID=762486 RepID=A0A1H3F261_9FLAO|nr:hypothetical protein [Lutibacter oricola]SDX85133.1 hypothetical protein SAMN05444411_11098 [Lutibacter oricola]